MAIPTTSSSPVPSAFVDAKADTVSPIVDYETGGAGLQDTSEGLQYQVWTARTDGTDITIEADNSPAQVVYSGVNITEISLAFDSNMNYFLAFVENGQAKYKWYDSTISGFTVTSLGVTDTNPRCTLDDKRLFNSSGRDVILCYLRNDTLYGRSQRDRYTIEYNLGAITPGKKLAKIGMGEGLRVNYLLSNSLYINEVYSEKFKINNTVEFSFFMKLSAGTNYAIPVTLANANTSLSVTYENNSLYIAMFNLKLCKITDVEETLVNSNCFIGVNAYITPDNRPGFEELNKTVVELYLQNTSLCNAMIVKTEEVYYEQLNGTLFDFLYGDSSVYIGSTSEKPSSTILTVDKLLVSSSVKTIGEYKLYLDSLGVCSVPSAGNLATQIPTSTALNSLALYPNDAKGRFYINAAEGKYKAEIFGAGVLQTKDWGTFVVDPNDPEFDPNDYEIYATNNGGDLPTSGIALNTWHTIGSVFVYWEWLVTVSYEVLNPALLVTVRRKDDISNMKTFEIGGHITKEN